jgi:hypothetical protein
LQRLSQHGLHWPTVDEGLDIYIIDHNPSWKENQRQKRESFWIRELQTLHPDKQKGLNLLLFFYSLTSAWSFYNYNQMDGYFA